MKHDATYYEERATGQRIGRHDAQVYATPALAAVIEGKVPTHDVLMRVRRQAFEEVAKRLEHSGVNETFIDALRRDFGLDR